MLESPVILLGILVNTLGSSYYFYETLKGKIKPNRVSFFIWTLAPFIAFLAQISQGIGPQAWLSLSYAVLTAFILIASFVNKKAYWQITRFDLSCGALALIGLLLWQVTQIGNIAILFSILADGLGALPTLVKGYNYPETERALPYLGASFAGFTGVISVNEWTFAAYGFPLYAFIGMGIIYLVIQYKLGKKFRKLKV